MLKRFMVFGYVNYYPLGGLDDVIASYDTHAEAVLFGELVRADYDRIQVFDREEGTATPLKWAKRAY